jgi:hypothetical protein
MTRHIFVVLIVLSLLDLSCKYPESPAAPSVEGGVESLTDPTIMPKIIYTFPPRNSIGPYNTNFDYNSPIEIRFNKLMDIESLRRAISLTPSNGIARIEKGCMYTDQCDIIRVYRFMFDPTDRFWKVGQKYLLRIDSLSRDINGNRLYPPFSFSFMPEPYFRITSCSPEDSTTEWDVTGAISLTFNSLIDTSILPKIEINPKSNGQWSLDDNGRVLYSQHYFEGDTPYIVTINSDAHDVYGNHLISPFSFRFRTSPFKVRYTETSGGLLETCYSGVSINFSESIDTASIRTALTISPPIDLNFDFQYDNHSVMFWAASAFVSDITYFVSVSNALRSWRNRPLQQPYSFTFKTPKFQVKNAYPFDRSSNVRRDPWIGISFTSYVDTLTVPSAFIVQPSVSGAFRFEYGTHVSSFSFVPDTALLANTRYTITLTDGIHAIDGKSLIGPFSYSFTTGN